MGSFPVEEKAANLIHSGMVKTILRRGSSKDPLYCLLVFTVITVSTAVLNQIGWASKSFLVPVLWGLGAILPLRSEEGDLLTFGFKGSLIRKNLLYFLISSVVIFPAYAVGFHLYVHWGLPASAARPFGGTSFFHWILYNFLAIALFEELFFRGFVQGRFENWAKVKFLKSSTVFWVPIFVSAFLFALAHVAVYLDPLRMSVFFPGLLFGWLRARTGSLLAPILSHGTANLVSLLLISSL